MTITLIPTIPTVAALGAMSKDEIQNNLPILDFLLESTEQSRLTDEPIGVRFSVATDEQGNTYEKLEFIIAARWYVNGDLWVSGAGFKVNFSEFITQTRNAFTQAL